MCYYLELDQVYLFLAQFQNVKGNGTIAAFLNEMDREDLTEKILRVCMCMCVYYTSM